MADNPRDRTGTLDAWWAAQQPVVTRPPRAQPSPWDALMERLTALEARVAALEAKRAESE